MAEPVDLARARAKKSNLACDLDVLDCLNTIVDEIKAGSTKPKRIVVCLEQEDASIVYYAAGADLITESIGLLTLVINRMCNE